MVVPVASREALLAQVLIARFHYCMPPAPCNHTASSYYGPITSPASMRAGPKSVELAAASPCLVLLPWAERFASLLQASMMGNGSRGRKVGGGARAARILRNRLKGRRLRLPWAPIQAPLPKATIIWTNCYSPRHGHYRRVEIIRPTSSKPTRNQSAPEIIYLHKESEDPGQG